jgi:hypothetical protein
LGHLGALVRVVKLVQKTNAAQSKTGTWDLGGTCKTCKQTHATKSKAGTKLVIHKLRTQATKSRAKKSLQNRLKNTYLQNRSGSCTSQVMIIEAFTSFEF